MTSGPSVPSLLSSGGK
ncbi:hypothetical protein Tco_0724709, partial [Tanacetum coccineum]